MTKIFISYRRDDSSYIAGIIYEKLEQHFGTDSVFFDIDSIPLGIDFRKHISDNVGKCDALLAIIGDSWIDATNNQGSRRLDDPTDFVRLEIESALKRDIPVIPVLVGKAPMPSSTELPSSLQDLAFRNAAEVRAGHDMQQHLTRLVKGIESLPQPIQPKNIQTDQSLHQRSDEELISTKSPRMSTTISTSLLRIKGMRKSTGKRWLFSALVFILFSAMGFGVGQLIYEFTHVVDGVVSWTGAVITWLVGFFLTYKVWKRY